MLFRLTARFCTKSPHAGNGLCSQACHGVKTDSKLVISRGAKLQDGSVVEWMTKVEKNGYLY